MRPEIKPVGNLARLLKNLREVQAKIGAAAVRSGRDPADVALVAVTKVVTADVASLLPEAGILDLGENRIRGVESKVAGCPAGIRWHMIGHLQRNKARKALEIFSLIHSVDTERLLTRLDMLAAERKRKAAVLLQVNISSEQQKHGIEPEALKGLLSRAAALPDVEIGGLMGMGPFAADPETCRPLFRDLRMLRDEANNGSWYRAPLDELSMGMSNDFEVAVEEGATLLRIGTALFTGLDPDEAGSPERASEER
jgi:pyridoxal phosphate enzyme (YggS family)